jgi:hypothetical protein
VSKVKNEKKNDSTPMIKTKVRPNNTVEVEMKAPQKSLLGKILIWVLIGGMTVLGLAALIVLIVQVAGNL